MAYYKFADRIMKNEPIDVYNNGNLSRDFTYIDDIIEGIEGLINHPPTGEGPSLHRIVNIGRSQPVNLLEFIEKLEKYLGKKATKNFLPMQQGDVSTTWADTSVLKQLTGYAPTTNLDNGIRKFVDWYRDYHHHRIAFTEVAN
jgi:UDP-glucuronate 4-epimerase